MTDQLTSLVTIFTEFYYWLTVVIMFLIHVGFCMYEVGASRHKNHMHTLMKNTMLIPLVTITFFFFGWWIYFAFPNGPWIYRGPRGSAPRRPLERGHGRAHGRRGRRGERMGAHQRRVLGRVPPVLLDRRVHRVGLGDRAHPLGRVLDPRGRDRVGVLDHRRGLGLARGRLDGPAPRLPRRLRVRGHPRDRGRLRARDPGGAGPAHREVRVGRDAAQHPSAQPLAGRDRALPHLHRLLGLLRGLQHPHLGRAGGRRACSTRPRTSTWGRPP